MAQAGPAAPVGFCQTFRWTALGTAGGPAPTAERAEPSNLLQAGGRSYLVDTGDGTVNQLAKVGVNLGSIAAVFISHHHNDHTGGLAAVIGLRWMNQFPGVLTVYGPPGTREMVDGIVASLQPQARVGFGLGAHDRPPETSVRVVELQGGATEMVDDLSVDVAANSHFDHPGPKSATEPQSLSYRFQLGPRGITYTGDTGPSEAVLMLAKGSNMLVSEVIDLDRLMASIRLMRKDAPAELLGNMERHLSSHHLQAEAIGQIAAAASVRQVVLTHFAIPPGPLAASEQDLRAGIARHYTGQVSLAHDLASFEVNCSVR